MSGRKILTAQERTFCLLYAMHPEAPIGALISAFDVRAIPEKEWGLFCGELMERREIELEIYVQHRILTSSNQARLASEYEEVRLEALAAGDLVLAASCIAAKAMLAGYAAPGADSVVGPWEFEEEIPISETLH